MTTGEDVRNACRDGRWSGQTSGLAPGYVQANLVIVPERYADDFRTFCLRNSRPCPVIDETHRGSPVPRTVAPSADLRTDLPRYRVWCEGKLIDEPTEITSFWQDDFVSFLLGCSFTFEAILDREGIRSRHVELGRNVPMYRTSIPCESAGPFVGPLVVSMRPLKPADAIRAVELTSAHPGAHGAPVHIGLPKQIGIDDLARPHYGEAVPIADDELPVFWACGVTPQAALEAAKLPIAITHAPGCMFVTDMRIG